MSVKSITEMNQLKLTKMIKTVLLKVNNNE